MSSNFAGSEHEIVPGALRGYRAWRYDRSETLHACNFDQIQWSAGRNEASCRLTVGEGEGRGNPNCFTYGHRDWHAAPQANCSCGFYAKHLPGDYDHRGNVIGVIKAYGKVILGTLGFRAQYAEIEALFPLYVGGIEPESLCASLVEDYRVPVFVNHEEMLEQFPPISVKELLPEPTEDTWDLSQGSGMPISGFAMSAPLTQAQWNNLMQQFFPGGQAV